MAFQKEYILIRIWMSLVLLVALAHGAADGIDNEPSESFSESASPTEPIEDRNPCSFRGQFLLHKEQRRIDPCTLCSCANGTTTCNIRSCPSEAGCPVNEVTFIREECCPQCPYRMTVENIYNLYDDNFVFAEGDSRRIRFGIDIEIDRQSSSKNVHGKNLWKLGAWLSRHGDGSGQKFSFEKNVLDEKDAAKAYDRPTYRYAPWHWSKLKYIMNFAGGTLDDYKFFCVEFGQADNPGPLYDRLFTFQPVDNESERLVDCVALDGYNGVTAEELDWKLRAENASYGQSTPVSLNVEVIFTRESAHMRRHGEGLWRVALFVSGKIDGLGPRFSEIRQVLDMEEMAISKKGRNLTINDIAADFEIGTIGCTGNAQYVCVEFAQGDTPDPPFRMTINTSTNTLVKCKEQECSSYTWTSKAPNDTYPTDDTHTAIPLTVILILVVSLLALALLVGTLLMTKWRNRLRPRSSDYNDMHGLDDVTS